MKDYVTHTLGCMEMYECKESDCTQGYESELQNENRPQRQVQAISGIMMARS